MAVFTQSVLSPDALYLQPKSYSAQSDRKPFQDILSPGVVGTGDFLVTTTTLLGISIAAGTAWVLGQNISDQGLYRQYIASPVTLTVGAANGTNPRLDQIILRVMDTAADASTFSEARIEIVPGTATAGATLDNRTGAANLATLGEASKSVLLLCDVLVPAAATTITGANIRDRRLRARVGGGGALAESPAGVVFPYAGSSAPTGYLMCDGTSYTTALQSRLFAAIGYTFGGSGLNFNVPNCLGKTIIGAGASGGAGLSARALAIILGEENHALSGGENGPHSHGGATVGAGSTTDGVGDHQHGMSANILPNRQGTQTGNATEAIGVAGSYTTGIAMTPAGGHSHNVNSHAHGINSDGSGTAHNNMQPSIALNYIIRAG